MYQILNIRTEKLMTELHGIPRLFLQTKKQIKHNGGRGGGNTVTRVVQVQNIFFS